MYRVVARALAAVLKASRGAVGPWLKALFKKFAGIVGKSSEGTRAELRSTLTKVTGQRGTIDQQFQLALREAEKPNGDFGVTAGVIISVLIVCGEEAFDYFVNSLPKELEEWWSSFGSDVTSDTSIVQPAGASYPLTLDPDQDGEFTPDEIQLINDDFHQVIQITGSKAMAAKFLVAVHRLTQNGDTLKQILRLKE